MNKDELREALAEYTHGVRSIWMRYLFNATYSEGHGVCVSDSFLARGRRQMTTAYANLSEEEKESARVEADDILTIVGSGSQR